MARPLFKDRICAVVAAPSAREMTAQLRLALQLGLTVELRLDWLPEEQRFKFTSWLLNTSPQATVIVTCRRRIAGGRFAGSAAAQNTQLAMGKLSALYCGSVWIDEEIETLRQRPSEYYESTPYVSHLGFESNIASYHNFREAPRTLLKILAELGSHRAQCFKIATQCNSYADVLRVLALCKGRRNVIAVPMGEIGLPGRVLALRNGSALAYAAVGEKTAPGQLTLDEMKDLYRADKLDRRTRVYGVIGNPVSHSLSPLLHNTGFITRRMNDVYLPFLVPDLRDFLRAVHPLGIHGFSVTLPHKQAILRHLDDCDPLAAAIGAVNTVVVRPGGKLYGYNTDYVGVLRALQQRVALRGSRVLLYGAGGAARAIAFALVQEGAIVNICARRPSEARKLACAAGGKAIERRQLRREFFDAIVNATPVGMHPRAGASPLRAEELNCRLVFDSIYRPQKTRLLQLAARRGIETVSGIEMFIAQGTAQWEIWTGLRAPEKQMRAAVLAKLRAEERVT
jgi:3-dehydroquinate dehydratase/shikimate dehydrogenase